VAPEGVEGEARGRLGRRVDRLEAVGRVIGVGREGIGLVGRLGDVAVGVVGEVGVVAGDDLLDELVGPVVRVGRRDAVVDLFDPVAVEIVLVGLADAFEIGPDDPAEAVVLVGERPRAGGPTDAGKGARVGGDVAGPVVGLTEADAGGAGLGEVGDPLGAVVVEGPDVRVAGPGLSPEEAVEAPAEA
jgi:hypothetical protein